MKLEGDLAKIYIRLTEYGETSEKAVNLAVECDDCHEVLIDADIPEELLVLTCTSLQVVQDINRIGGVVVAGDKFAALNLGTDDEPTLELKGFTAVRINDQWFIALDSPLEAHMAERFKKAGGDRD